MNIVIIAGSNRSAATSTQLAEYVKLSVANKGYQAKLFDLYETPLPFYSPDKSFANDPAVTGFHQAMMKADAVVLASPEYHGGMSGVLKNALDHLGQEHFNGKPVLCLSSAGGAVGVSSLQQMQATVRNLHGINCPEWLSIGGSQRKRFEKGYSGAQDFKDMEDRMQSVINSFVELTQLVRGRLHADVPVSV
jgi:azobenzene reductase